MRSLRARLWKESSCARVAPGSDDIEEYGFSICICRFDAEVLQRVFKDKALSIHDFFTQSTVPVRDPMPTKEFSPNLSDDLLPRKTEKNW